RAPLRGGAPRAGSSRERPLHRAPRRPGAAFRKTSDRTTGDHGAAGGRVRTSRPVHHRHPSGAGPGEVGRPRVPAQAGPQHLPVPEQTRRSEPADRTDDTSRNDVVRLPSPDLVEVPELVDDAEEQRKRIQTAGLEVGEVRTEVVEGDGGRVLRSRPEPGTRVPRGGTVDLVISEAGARVGDVRGLTAAAARGRLTRAGFKVS